MKSDGSVLPNIRVSKDLRTRLDRQIKRMKARDDYAEGATLAGLVRQFIQDGLGRIESENEKEAYSIKAATRRGAAPPVRE